jgi:hypothetical protein
MPTSGASRIEQSGFHLQTAAHLGELPLSTFEERGGFSICGVVVIDQGSEARNVPTQYSVLRVQRLVGVSAS